MSRALTKASLALFLIFFAGCGRSQLGSPDASLPDADVVPGECSDDGDCDDSNPCNGSESCVDGTCRAGTPVLCDDGVDCTADTCDPSSGECLVLPDHDQCASGETCDPELGCRRAACIDNSDCDDGFVCNGSEFCQGGFCEAGTPPSCDDGIECTSEVCDEELGGCVVTYHDDRCDDGRFCNGVETCSADIGCTPGRPVSCDDGDDCTDDSCDETTDSCIHLPGDADRDGWASCECSAEPCDCDDDDITVNPGMTEQCRDLRDNDCDGLVDCEDRADCASDPRCETTTCTSDAECDDGIRCNGREICTDEGLCIALDPPSCDDDVECTRDVCVETDELCLHFPEDDLCPGDARCDPILGCVSETCTSDEECDDGLFCNGEERCIDGSCASGTAPECDDGILCTEETCDEWSDRCVSVPVHARCDDGLFCTGEERCVVDVGCVSGEDPCVEGSGCEIATCIEAEDRCEFSPVDADTDGFVDEDCGGEDCDDDNPAINPLAAEICGDGADNDCDGNTDCADSDCADLPICCVPTGPEICDDLIDNDCDGRIDCEDLADCRRDPVCCEPTGPEICDDLIDNDCDGFTDCSDFFDCRSDPACEECTPELCWDEEDNDCDDLVDCEDNDCSWFPPCDTPEIERDCHNEEDDDGDGAVDCDDPDCAVDPWCPEPDTCADAIEITGAGTYTGTTAPLENDYEPDTTIEDCAGGRGPDAVYFGSASRPMWILADTFGSDYDTVLFVREADCEGGEQIACNDDTDGLQSEILFRIDAGVTYYLFVDGFGRLSEGDFELHIQTFPVTSEICDNGIDDDLDTLVDCDDPDCAGTPECTTAPERGVAGCTDGRDNDGDGLVDCDDTDDCSVLDIPMIGPECCDGVDDNGDPFGLVDEFACACSDADECDSGYCYVETAGACGPSCLELGGDMICDMVFPGSSCDFITQTCIYD